MVSISESHLCTGSWNLIELCVQVNEGVREKENSDRLEWIQAHVQCEGLSEVQLSSALAHDRVFQVFNQQELHLYHGLFFSQQLVFNSVTNCLGPRKFLHSGKLFKAKSSKELYGFLFNDFLLLTQVKLGFFSFLIPDPCWTAVTFASPPR